MGVLHKTKARAAEHHATMTAPSLVASTSPGRNTSKYPRFGKRGAPQAFPSKLYEILEGENPDIVGWTETGRGFEVRDHARLSSEVLGRFFKQDKFSSFQRQLNLYGFRKITKGIEAGSYQHPHFRRGERTTLLTIRRSTKASPATSAGPGAPARVLVPSSPASAVPLAGGGADKSRPATPSPPPGPVARGVLPWPRPLASFGMMQRSDSGGAGSRGASPDCGGDRAVSTDDGRHGDTDVPDGRLRVGRPQASSSSQTQQAGGAHKEEAVAYRGGGGSGGGYVDSVGGHAGGGAGGRWESADRSTRREDDGGGWKEDGKETTERRGGGGGGRYDGDGGGPQWTGEGSVKKERERAQGLDHQDVEVVGLLHRMAKDAQDSPSRMPREQQDAASTSTRWEGEGRAQQQQSQQKQQKQQQQPAFRMPKLQPSDRHEPQHPQQGQDTTAFADRMYDILNNERESNTAQQQQQRTPLPFGFAANRNRPATGFPHHHRRLPVPYPTEGSREGSREAPASCMGSSYNTAVDAKPPHHRDTAESSRSRSGSPDVARGGAFGVDSDGNGVYNTGGSGGSGSSSSSAHHVRERRQQQDGPAFESNPSRTTVAGDGGGGGGGSSSFENRPFRARLGSSNLPAPTASFGRYAYDDQYRGMQDQQDGSNSVHGGGGGGMDSGGSGGRPGGGSGMGPGGFRPASRGHWQGPEGPYAAVGRGVW